MIRKLIASIRRWFDHVLDECARAETHRQRVGRK